MINKNLTLIISGYPVLYSSPSGYSEPTQNPSTSQGCIQPIIQYTPVESHISEQNPPNSARCHNPGSEVGPKNPGKQPYSQYPGPGNQTVQIVSDLVPAAHSAVNQRRLVSTPNHELNTRYTEWFSMRGTLAATRVDLYLTFRLQQ